MGKGPPGSFGQQILGVLRGDYNSAPRVSPPPPPTPQYGVPPPPLPLRDRYGGELGGPLQPQYSDSSSDNYGVYSLMPQLGGIYDTLPQFGGPRDISGMGNSVTRAQLGLGQLQPSPLQAAPPAGTLDPNARAYTSTPDTYGYYFQDRGVLPMPPKPVAPPAPDTNGSSNDSGNGGSYGDD